MVESRYEKYVIRKPAILVKDGEIYVDRCRKQMYSRSGTIRIQVPG